MPAFSRMLVWWQPTRSGRLAFNHATAHLGWQCGIAGLFDISTPSVFRRQGFGSAISWHLLQEAYRRGYQQAYVWSSAMGKGVYQRVGFVPVVLGMREYCWQKV